MFCNYGFDEFYLLAYIFNIHLIQLEPNSVDAVPDPGK
jgi:hypothetical protein